ncbi:unnamed protein product [Pleuronectes platessa]|uniref:Uncharacterized protein n=1 Tax=Pleuronectes platessa TaxID=8262 RepID=A0A9N7VGN5_PLEPL|nr:unnamed protein product [Pleuronectes platessa]
MAGLSTDGTGTRGEAGRGCCARVAVVREHKRRKQTETMALMTGRSRAWTSGREIIGRAWFIRLDNTRDVHGRQKDGGGHGAAEVCRPPTQSHPHAAFAGHRHPLGPGNLKADIWTGTLHLLMTPADRAPFSSRGEGLDSFYPHHNQRLSLGLDAPPDTPRPAALLSMPSTVDT